MNKDIVTSFVRQWNFVRSETLEILNSLDDQSLVFKPKKGDKWQPLYNQFGCIGRTQIVYTEAIKLGKMDFSLFSSNTLPQKNQFKTKKQLLDFLESTNRAWIEAVRSKRHDPDFAISWPGFNQLLINHITSLISHERIHHGQFISYFTLAGLELPESFKRNWAL